MDKTFKIRDLRKKDQYKIDDAYLNGYARLCGVYATAVYNSLSRHANFHTQECFPSMDKIAEQHSISKPSVIKGIAELVKWNIVAVHKEKDPNTKRQMPNVYVLVDKSDWKPKPESRVKEIDSETSKPSKRQEKSRVSQIDCKEYKGEKDNKLSEDKSSGNYTIEKDTEEKSSKPDRRVKEKESVFLLFGGRQAWWLSATQRTAALALIDAYKFEQVAKAVSLAKLNKDDPFCPKVNTPTELVEKWGALLDYNYRTK